jgi:hypothetical protein
MKHWGSYGIVSAVGSDPRGEPVRYLVRMIDDATSRSGGSFVQHDGTRENMGVLWQYVERQGRMVDVYTDRAGMFMVAPRSQESAQQRQEADRLTQIGRGLRELGIGWISNDYTFSYAGRRYQLARQQVKAGMRGNLRIEFHLSGAVRARFEGQYVEISECGRKAPAAAKTIGKPVHKDHNRGGKSDWMESFRIRTRLITRRAARRGSYRSG